MNTTYAQRQTTAQKKDAPSASSIFDASSQSESLQRKADMANGTAQRVETPRPNNTGMPDNLKAGIETLSGFSMDDVRVHYNSSKPATVQALAYTQGTDIHVAPGQEKHLPHEAWHVAQQMAGRVSPTTNINGMPVNDNAALEHEADVMGEKAVQCEKDNNSICSMGKCNSIIQMSVSPGDVEKTMARVMASSSRTPVGWTPPRSSRGNGKTTSAQDAFAQNVVKSGGRGRPAMIVIENQSSYVYVHLSKTVTDDSPVDLLQQLKGCIPGSASNPHITLDAKFFHAIKIIECSTDEKSIKDQLKTLKESTDKRETTTEKNKGYVLVQGKKRNSIEGYIREEAKNCRNSEVSLNEVQQHYYDLVVEETVRYAKYLEDNLRENAMGDFRIKKSSNKNRNVKLSTPIWTIEPKK